MYIAKAEGAGLIPSQATKTFRKTSGDTNFEETVITLLTDAVELTNPNGERSRRDQQPPHEEEGPPQAELPPEDAESAPKSSLNITA